MSELKSQLRSDLTTSMKARDKLRTATIRMLLAAIQTEEVSGKEAHDLTDEQVLKVLAKVSARRGKGRKELTA